MYQGNTIGSSDQSWLAKREAKQSACCIAFSKSFVVFELLDTILLLCVLTTENEPAEMIYLVKRVSKAEAN